MTSLANVQMAGSGSEMRAPEAISRRCEEVQSPECNTPSFSAGRFESSKTTSPLLLPKDYESKPIFSYNLDTTKNLTWDSDAELLHSLWMQNANKGVPDDHYPHAAIKRLMRLNPSVFQVCSEVLAPISMLADMFVGMLLLGASGSAKRNQQAAVITEKDVVHSSIAPNPLLTWAIDAVDVETLLDLQAEDDHTVLANVLPELLIREHSPSIKQKLTEAHFKLLAASDDPFGDFPQIDHEFGHLIPRSKDLGCDAKSDDFSARICTAQAPDQRAHAVMQTQSMAASESSEHQHPVFLRTSENRLSASNTQNQSLHASDQILDTFVAPEFNFNITCQETQKIFSQGCCLNENSSHMNYVTFFSNIDPIWLSHAVDHDLELDSGDFEGESYELMKDAGIDCLQCS
jgi:hypothetical protein